MQITIDTKQDSLDEIKKAIRLLQSIVDESNISGSSSPANYDSGNLMSMFGDSSSSSAATSAVPKVDSATDILIDVDSKKQKKIAVDDDEDLNMDMPQLIPY
jgi:hypothetical protein